MTQGKSLEESSVKIASWLVLCTFVVLSFASAMAQQAPSTPTTNDTAQAQSVQQTVTEYRLPPEKMAKALALYKIRVVLYLFSSVFGIALLVALLWLRVPARFRNIAEHASKNRFVQALVFVPLLMLTMAVISIPLEMYGHHISRAYGLSVQGWGSWFLDWGKGELISLAISVPLVYALFLIIRWSPQRWWLHFWVLTSLLVVLLVFVAPVILDPIFFKFEPLEKTQPQLVSEIEKVTHRGGLNIPRSRMFEMKASEKVTTYNAYVTGIGATKRVVVWDNTAKDLTVPQTMFVFGHEQGHYVLNHIYKGMALACVGMLIAFWLGRKIVMAMLARWGEGWGIRGLSDYAALPVLMLALSLLTLVGEPVQNAFSRYLEHQADVYGLEVTHGLYADSGQVAAQSFQKLGEKSYSYPTPNPVLVFWSYDHPPITDRIRFSLSYDPWHGGEGPQFVR